MRCLVLEPGYYPYISMFQSLKDAADQMMSGPVEITLPFDNNVIALMSQCDQPVGLTKAQADRYYRKYLYPECIEETAIGEMIASCPNPKNKPQDERFGKKPNWLER